MKRNTDYLNKRILELTEELEVDLELNEMNLKDKSMKTPGLKSKWIQIYYEELDYQEKLEEAKEKLKEKYMGTYGEDPNQPRFMVERKVSENQDIKKLNKAFKEQQKVVRYLTDVNKNIMSGFNFDIKNSQEILKMEMM